MVTDYLWDEVLGRQSAQTRLFLLRTSITERVSGELADELTGEPGAAMMLERLSRESGFVEALSHEHAQYRYHPLLRDVLVAELHRQIPHEVPVLLRRAARWHAAHGQPVEAVRCAAQAGDWDYAAHVLAEAGVAALLQSGAAELQTVLALFPADRWADDAAVAAALASVRLWHGDPDGATHHLDAARRGLGRCGEAASRVIEPWLAALRVLQAASQAGADPGLLAQGWNLAEHAQASAGSLAEHRALGLLWFALGAARLRRWEIQDARYALDHADRQLAAGSLAGLRMRSLGWQALADSWYGDLARAAREAGAVRASSSADATARCLADLATAQVSLARDDLSAAQQLLDLADQQPAGQLPGEPAPGVVSALIRARVLLADGDTAGARGLVIRLRELHAAADPALDGVLNVLDGEIALRSGDTGRARILLALTEEGAYFDRADGRLAQGRLLLSDADYKGALEAVAPCLDGTADAMTLRDKVAALLVSTVAHRRLRADRQRRRVPRAGAGAGRARRCLPGLPRRRAACPVGDHRAGAADQPQRGIRGPDPGAVRHPDAAQRRAAGANGAAADRQRAGRAQVPALAHDQPGDRRGAVLVDQHGQDPPALGLPQARRRPRGGKPSPGAAVSTWSETVLRRAGPRALRGRVVCRRGPPPAGPERERQHHENDRIEDQPDAEDDDQQQHGDRGPEQHKQAGEEAEQAADGP